MPRAVFIIAPAGRCGTNYLGNLLETGGAGRMVAAPEDYLLHHANLLDQYVQLVAQSWTAWIEDHQLERERVALLRFLGEALISYMRDGLAEDERAILKTPSTRNLSLFPRLFSTAKLLLLVRDGRDVAISSARAWPELSISEWSTVWAQGADDVLAFMKSEVDTQGSTWMLVRFEDLVRRQRETMAGVLEFLGVDSGSVDAGALGRLPVYGSSFAGGPDDEFRWNVSTKSADFDPVGRWRSCDEAEIAEVARKLETRLTQFEYDVSS